jgi:hypothetical protein
MALRKFLILRSRESGCLEGRTALIQPRMDFLPGLSASPALLSDVCLMRTDPVITCFTNHDSRNSKGLRQISFLSRAARTGTAARLAVPPH